MKRYPSTQKFTAVVNFEGDYSTMHFEADVGTKTGKRLVNFLKEEVSLAHAENDPVHDDQDFVDEYNSWNRKKKLYFLNENGAHFEVCAIFPGKVYPL